MQQGISQLIPLGFRNTPAFDTSDFVAESWAQALWPQQAWSITTDADRIATAFRILAANSEFWPVPKKLIESLPPRRQPESWRPRERQPLSAERRAAIAELITDLQEKLNADTSPERRAAIDDHIDETIRDHRQQAPEETAGDES